LAISFNYVMHGFIWHRSAHFAALCRGPLSILGNDPVEVFSNLEVLAKLIQAAALALLLGSAGVSAAMASVASAPWWCWATLFFLVGAGQGLNFATYAAIGKAGVYYGFKFGRTVPWCHGFPFNTGLRHPQYLGVVLTLWGGLLLLLCQDLSAAGIPQLVFAWAGMYIVMCAMEESGDNDKTS